MRMRMRRRRRRRRLPVRDMDRLIKIIECLESHKNTLPDKNTTIV